MSKYMCKAYCSPKSCINDLTAPQHWARTFEVLQFAKHKFEQIAIIQYVFHWKDEVLTFSWMLEFGCLRKLVIAGCFACSLASAVCPSLAIWRLRSASPWWAHDKVRLQTLQWNKDLSEVTEETKGYFTIQSFLNLLLYFAAPAYLAFFMTGESESDSELKSAIMCGRSMLPGQHMWTCATVMKPTG